LRDRETGIEVEAGDAVLEMMSMKKLNVRHADEGETRLPLPLRVKRVGVFDSNKTSRPDREESRGRDEGERVESLA
jgi:hypothetical protein